MKYWAFILNNILAIFLFIDTVKAQVVPSPYAAHAWELQREGKLGEAIEEYKRDYSQKANYTSAIQVAALYSVTDIRDSAFFWLDKLLTLELPFPIYQEERFYHLLNYPVWAVFEEKYILIFEAKFGQVGNIELARRLWHLGMKDQAYSFEWNLSNRMLGDASPITKAVLLLQEKNRSENMAEVDRLIAAHGWPRLSDVGSCGSRATFYIVQHVKDVSKREEYIGRLKEACESNEANWKDFATMYDRLLVEKTGKQLYGTQKFFNSQNQLELRPIEDPDNVNTRRQEVGLSPLK